jgi:hypothetical protein
VAVKTATGHAQDKFSLHFIAGPNTAEAVDAFGKIGSHVRMAQVFCPVEVVFAFRITDVANAHPGSHGLKLAIVVDLAGEAVQRVVGQHQFNDVAPQFFDSGAVGIDVRIGYNRRMAGGLGFGGSVLHQGNINAAHPAGSKGVEVGRVAEGWNQLRARCLRTNLRMVSPCKILYGLSLM